MADDFHDTPDDGLLPGTNDRKDWEDMEVESFSLQSKFALEAYTESFRIKTR